MTLTPIDDRVVIRPDSPAKKSAGGIMLPDTAKDKPQRGKVVAAGSGLRLQDGTRSPLTVKQGNTVIFERHRGIEVDDDSGSDTKLLVLREHEIIGIVGE